MAQDIDKVLDKLLAVKKDEQAPRSILRLAIALEEACKASFEASAKQVKDPKGRDMFRFLAKDEISHIRLLKTELRALERDPEWLEKERVAVPIESCMPVTPKRLEKDAKKAAKAVQAGKGDAPAGGLDALKTAISAKEKALRFYCEASALMPGPAGKKMLAHLMDLEKRHLDELRVQYAWLDQAGFWYDASMMTD